MSYGLLILIVYLGTLLTSFGIKSVNIFLLIKDLATYSYKVDWDELDYSSEDVELFNLRKTNIENFIPFYNIYKSIEGMYQYFSNFHDNIDKLEDLDIIGQMAKFETYEYLKHPSIINLFKVLIKGKKRIDKACFFEVLDNDGFRDGIAVYEKTDDIDIIDTQGVFNHMTLPEAKEIIRTNDSNGLFDNYVHYDGKKKMFVTKNKIVKDNIEKINCERQEKLDKLYELKRFLSFYKAKDEEEEQKILRK